MNWNEQSVESLAKMWRDGLSCSTIAAALGQGCTRNAVIGKIHRLGLSAPRPVRMPKIRAHGNAGQPKVRAIRARAAQRHSEGGSKAQLDAVRVQKGIKFGKLETGEPVAADLGRLEGSVWEALPGTLPVTLLAAARDACKWPIGDPREPGFGFCGCAAMEGKPYCPTHQRRAVTAPAGMAQLRHQRAPELA